MKTKMHVFYIVIIIGLAFVALSPKQVPTQVPTTQTPTIQATSTASSEESTSHYLWRMGLAQSRAAQEKPGIWDCELVVANTLATVVRATCKFAQISYYSSRVNAEVRVWMSNGGQRLSQPWVMISIPKDRNTCSDTSGWLFPTTYTYPCGDDSEMVDAQGDAAKQILDEASEIIGGPVESAIYYIGLVWDPKSEEWTKLK